MRGGWVYILANRYRGTIYIRVTSDIAARVWKHRSDPEGFVARYLLNRLVHAEPYPTIGEAIAREVELIEKDNPDWLDLYETINA